MSAAQLSWSVTPGLYEFRHKLSTQDDICCMANLNCNAIKTGQCGPSIPTPLAVSQMMPLQGLHAGCFTGAPASSKTHPNTVLLAMPQASTPPCYSSGCGPPKQSDRAPRRVQPHHEAWHSTTQPAVPKIKTCVCAFKSSINIWPPLTCSGANCPPAATATRVRICCCSLASRHNCAALP